MTESLEAGKTGLIPDVPARTQLLKTLRSNRVKSLAIGIAGTAKNTGKTTTMSIIMNEIKKNPEILLGLTSIGYDGEKFDNVTGLPKPRIEVWPGNIVAIAESCMKVCSAELEEIQRTDIATPLGKVIISRVAKAGKVLLAGPNNSRDLRIVLELLRGLANLTIVDGALNRIAPMVEVDGLILVTGAARFTEIPRLAEDTRCIVDILSTPVLAEQGKTEALGSILGQSGFDELLQKCAAADSINIQGVAGLQYLKELAALRGGELKGKRFIFNDPIKLLLAGEALQVHKVLYELSNNSGAGIGVAKACKLLAMTVNPYYPKYRYNRADYEEAYVDSAGLLACISASAGIPCYDVFRQGGKELYKIIIDYWNTMGL